MLIYLIMSLMKNVMYGSSIKPGINLEFVENPLTVKVDLTLENSYWKLGHINTP